MTRQSPEEFDLSFFNLANTETGSESHFFDEINSRDINLKNIISSPDHITKYQLDFIVFNLFYQQFQATGFQDPNFFESNDKKIEKLIDFEINNREFVTEIIEILTTKNGKCEFFDVTNSIDQLMHEISIYDSEFNERHQLHSLENTYDLLTKSKAAQYFHKKLLRDPNPRYLQENIKKIQFFIDFEKFAPKSFDHIISKYDGDIEKTHSQSNALRLMLFLYFSPREKKQNIENFFREYEKERIKEDESTMPYYMQPTIQTFSTTMAQTSRDSQPIATQVQLPSSSPVNLGSPQSPLSNSFDNPRLP